MRVFLARDGKEIGEYPREKLEGLARAGKAEPTDYYWWEGMEEWLLLRDLLPPEAWEPEQVASDISVAQPEIESPLPSVPTPGRSRNLFPMIALSLVALALVVVVFLLVRRSPSGTGAAPLLLEPAAATARTRVDPEAVREKAIADLKQKIQRLPGKPEAPLQTFYYDLAVDMQKTLSERAPWAAVIRGDENVVDPETAKTLTHTDFSLTIDYEDGVWTFRRYHASVSDMVHSVTRDITDDERTPTPPSVAGMLGLKLPAH